MLDEDKMDKFSISERNEHYYDADETYSINVRGA